jgi:hypothetical protein
VGTGSGEENPSNQKVRTKLSRNPQRVMGIGAMSRVRSPARGAISGGHLF